MAMHKRGRSLFAYCTGIACCLAFAAAVSAQVRINEVDADTQGTDVLEFVELYDGGAGNTSLNGRVLVLFNGSSDTSYAAFDLDGFSTNGQGYFVVGSSTLTPPPGLAFPNPSDNIQNGVDAVALYQANASDFPNGTAITTVNLLDAIVYKAANSDVDDPELQALLNAAQPQVVEGGQGNATTVSMHRCPNGSGGLRNTASYALTNPTPAAAPTCPPTTGACCTGGTNCQVLTPSACAGISGAVFVGLGSTCTPGLCPVSFPGVKINEIRNDTPGTDMDEFIEIVGPAGTSLNGLTVFNIGDGPAGSGVIERTINLAGSTIPADGHFLIAGDVNTFGVAPDLNLGVASDMIENSDNMTFLLVAGFTGAQGDDLDTDDDGVLNTTPWVQELDRVCLVEMLNPPSGAGNEWYYPTNANQVVGPDGINMPALIYRLPDAGLPWNIGPFDPVNGLDTPGAINSNSGACCVGGTCSVITRDDCILVQGGVFKGVNTTCTANICTGACCNGVTCSVTDPVTCAGGGGVFQGAGTTCQPSPACGACMTIAQVRALPVASRVKLCNVTISSTTDLIQSGTVKSFQIEDTSGTGTRSGLTVFGSNAQIDAFLNVAGEGTQISLQGVTDQFNGLIELVDGSLPLAPIAIGGNGGTLPVASVTAADFQDQSATAEGFESEVVTLSCVRFLAANGSTTFQGGVAASNYLVTDGINTATVRISSNTQDFEGQVIPSGPVTITGIFSQSDLSAPLDGNYQLLPRDMFGPHNDLNTTPNCGPTGACCMAGATCQEGLTAALCTGVGGVFQGVASLCMNVTCPTVDGTIINEIRIDQLGNDDNEYFELKGPANVPLGSLSYIVIGDGAPTAGSGVIDAVIPLTNSIMPADGIFVAAESTFTLGPVDLTTNLNFEDNDNVTHLLVENFVGAPGDDLDTDDDGFLDSAPWSRVLSSIALVSDFSNPPVGTEWYYGPTVGPAPGGSSPAHVIRCAGALNDFIIGSVDLPPTGNDTPGAVNNCANACLTCYGDTDASQRVDIDDTNEFVDALLGFAPNVCADVDLNGVANGDDINNFIFLVMANTGAGTSCLPPARREIVRCDNASPPNDCPDIAGGFCRYTVDLNQAGIAPCVVASSPGPNQIAEGDTICVKCPQSANCGLPGDKVQFRWINQDGAGGDCNFYATLVQTNCTACGAGNKRFGDAPPPLAIKIVAYNLLNYTGADRETQFRTIMNALQADVVVANEVVGNTGANDFLSDVLNHPTGPGGYTMATFTDSSDTDNALYYRSARITYTGAGDHATISTSPRITDRWKIGAVGFAGAANQIYVYSTHLKAGSTVPDQNDRQAAALLIRANSDALPAGSNLVLCGDFNLQSSSEASYQTLTVNAGNGRFFDPINMPGNWNANSAFRAIHTQSPHNNNPNPPPGVTGGGMDDRFDFQVISAALNDGLPMSYRPGSYKAYGNDGNHFNNDINDPPTIPEGQPIADALHGASDHLPVVMEILLP